MSKIKFELDLSDVFKWDGGVDEYGNATGLNFDSWIEEEIVSQIKGSLSNKIEKAIDNKINEIMSEQTTTINETISEKLNSFMNEFFETPYDIRDKYGDVIKKDVCVKSLLKEACDDFINQKVDANGAPTTSVYTKTTSRIEYMVNKSWEQELKYEVTKLTDSYTKEIKKKLKEEISKQLGDKLANIVGLESMLN